ncbi:MAG: YlbF family regulator [Lachnospiraceae bacterium]|nr:YlbF family regulator [Lachnospiraceae bacterium]
MTSDIKEALDNLVEVIKQSQEYQEYVNAKAVLALDDNLAKKVDEYRRKNSDLQDNKDTLFDASFILQKQYEDIINASAARTFLTAENNICRIFQQINYKLLEDLNFELSTEEDDR